MMKMFMGTMKNCFSDCITDFRTDALNSNEKSCLSNCTKRNASMYEEVGQANQIASQRGGGAGGF